MATRNQGKVREVKRIFRKLLPAARFVSLAGFPKAREVRETGNTLEENAGKKARYAAGVSGLPALAEDSGIFVDALGGRPGVKSSRYSSKGDAANNKKMLHELRGVPAGKRGAAYKCVAALAVPGGRVFFARGECRGKIGFVEKGKNGFGYDPLFIPAGFAKTFAELGPRVKDGMSHRKRALKRILPAVKRLA